MKYTSIKWIIKSPFYVKFKKHYCPQCNALLQTVTESKIVHSDSKEAEEYKMNMMRGPNSMGPVKVVWTEFLCPICQQQFSIDQVKKIEGVK